MPSRKQKPLVELAMEALHKHDPELLRQALEQGLDPNCTVRGGNGKDMRLLALTQSQAYQAGQRQMAQCLIEHGASIETCRDEGVAFLYQAMHCEDEAYIQLVLSQIDNLYHPSEPPRYCDRVYTPTLLAMLVDKGMAREDVEHWCWVASFEYIPEAPEIIAWMARHGYCLDVRAEASGKTPLQSLMEDGISSQAELAVIRALIDNGACVDHIELEALCDKPCGVGDLARELMACRRSQQLDNTTSPATAQRAARRM